MNLAAFEGFAGKELVAQVVGTVGRQLTKIYTSSSIRLSPCFSMSMSDKQTLIRPNLKLILS